MMVRMQVQFTAQQARRLKQLAAENGCSTAALVRQSVDAALAQAHEPDRSERRKRALAAAGRYRSGVRDLATAHDRYLAEEYGR